MQQSYLYANRKEVELILHVIEGNFPNDIFGVVYFSSMCGSVNSEGLPVPEKHEGSSDINPEFGTPLLASDGMMFKVDFNTVGEAYLKTNILKPPCYYADLATSRKNSNTIEEQFKNYGFKSGGITRASIQLGYRNQLNTAIIPFRFKKDKHSRLLATFDAGRPWEFDAATVSLLTPVGYNAEWIKAMPPALKFPFPLVQTSAHPSFDAVTRELYTVNYTQKKTLPYQLAFFLLLLENRDEVKHHLEEQSKIFNKVHEFWEKVEFTAELIKGLKRSFGSLHDDPHFDPLVNEAMEKHQFADKHIDTVNALTTSDAVYLLKWNGKREPLKRWRIVDEQGNDIVIEECMHQLALTEEYILLADSSFKFTADILINNPFPEVPTIDKMLRWLLSEKPLHDMALYVVKRSELKENGETVRARRISLPVDCIHFVADYKNPSGNIILYTMNNNSVCVAEWIRPYDTLKISGKPVYNQLVGLPALAGMDINSVSKYVINSRMELAGKIDCLETGGLPGKVEKAHTWDIAFLTYRDMLSADKAVDKIEDLFIFSTGLSTERLTTFIYDLFKDLSGKVIPTNETMDYTKAGVPFSLLRIDTEDMKVKDFFLMNFNEEIRSLQFVPSRKESKSRRYSLNGYLLCTMMIGDSNEPNAPLTMNYKREIWLFEADNLAQGPICKLSHPELSYTFTLHSCWIPEAVSQSSAYKVDIRKDFSDLQSVLPDVQENIGAFFEKYIFPNFSK